MDPSILYSNTPNGVLNLRFRLDKAGSHRPHQHVMYVRVEPPSLWSIDRGTLYGKGIYFAECVTKADGLTTGAGVIWIVPICFAGR